MTVRHPAFWLYLLCLLALGVGTIGYILATQYHPSLELRDTFVVLDTDTASISVQWLRGQVSSWIWTKAWQWRVWPVW